VCGRDNNRHSQQRARMPPYCAVQNEQCVLKEEDKVVAALRGSSLSSATLVLGELSSHCQGFGAADCLLASKACDGQPGHVFTEAGCRPKPWDDWKDCTEEIRQHVCPHMADPNPLVHSLCPYSCAKDELEAAAVAVAAVAAAAADAV
jgi:hypothetical protein